MADSREPRKRRAAVNDDAPDPKRARDLAIFDRFDHLDTLNADHVVNRDKAGLAVEGFSEILMTFEAQRNSSKLEIDAIKTGYQRLLAERAETESRHEDAMTDIQEQLLSANQEVKQGTENMAILETDKEMALDQSRFFRDQLKRERKELNVEITTLFSKLNRKERALKLEKLEIARLQTKLEEAEGSVKAAGPEKHNLTAALAQVNHLSTEVEKLKKDLEASREKHDSLEEAAQSELDDAYAAKNQILEDLESTAEKLHLEEKDRFKLENDLEATKSDLVASNGEKNQVRSDFDELSIRYESLKVRERQLAQENEENSSELAKLASVRNELTFWRTTFQAPSADLETVRKENNTLRASNDSSDSKVKSLDAALSDLQMKNKSISSALEKAKQKLEAAESYDQYSVGYEEGMKRGHADEVIDTKKRLHQEMTVVINRLVTDWYNDQFGPRYKFLSQGEGEGWGINEIGNYCNIPCLKFAKEIIRRTHGTRDQAASYLQTSDRFPELEYQSWRTGRALEPKWKKRLTVSDKKLVLEIDSMYEENKPVLFKNARRIAFKFLQSERAIVLRALETHPWTKKCHARDVTELIEACILAFDRKFCLWIANLTRTIIPRENITCLGICSYTAVLGLDVERVLGEKGQKETFERQLKWWDSLSK
ncbi:uncharacterized protein LY89DRAFT_722369 [Mollisia scopiformis]|uniref:Uncharacterized protein n=1 Tax=Mollisia scopiformis TaxID=149040 RepID=A0A194WVI2_MOLSC|nr:uncharacterized protein LY89DRAFT_722369 [Mollisia scopiformis]KUJ11978.1 hypothetical protein LY89DRAFT_722369 [Mollisia scopiformis]